MTDWPRLIRAMLATGLTFAVGVGVLASVVAGMAVVLGLADPEIFDLVLGSTVFSFAIGVVFSGGLAITARGRSFRELSLLRFAALGVLGGVLLFGAAAVMAGDFWDRSTALLNLGIFTFLGGGAATTTLLLARRAGPSLPPSDESRSLPEK